MKNYKLIVILLILAFTKLYSIEYILSIDNYDDDDCLDTLMFKSVNKQKLLSKIKWGQCEEPSDTNFLEILNFKYTNNFKIKKAKYSFSNFSNDTVKDILCNFQIIDTTDNDSLYIRSFILFGTNLNKYIDTLDLFNIIADTNSPYISRKAEINGFYLNPVLNTYNDLNSYTLNVFNISAPPSINTDIVNIDYETNFNIYPNPANNNINFSLKTNKYGEYSINIANIHSDILSEQGITVSSSQNNHGQMSLEFLPTGCYFVSLKKDNQLIQVLKLLIIK